MVTMTVKTLCGGVSQEYDYYGTLKFILVVYPFRKCIRVDTPKPREMAL